jgi:nitrite reductase (NO-forming)
MPNTDRSATLTFAVVLSIASLIVGVAGMGAFIASDEDGTTAVAVDAEPIAEADAKPVTIDELSRHPSAMPENAEYATYRDGEYTDAQERRGPMNHEVYFNITEGVAEVVPGSTIDVWTFDGAVPGPMVRARVGDTIDFY